MSEPLAESKSRPSSRVRRARGRDAARFRWNRAARGARVLIDQFFWGVTNQRTDQYGGDFVARTRFAVDVVKACRRRTAPGFPIVLRFSQWKLQDYSARLVTTPDELGRFLAPLVDAGVDAFHCSTRRFWVPEFEGSALNLAAGRKVTAGRPSPWDRSASTTGFMSSLREASPRIRWDLKPSSR